MEEEELLYEYKDEDEESSELEVVLEPQQPKEETKSVIPEMPTIDGKNIYEFELDNLEDKPWKKVGADITDYFNYGFDENTWKMYCAKQRGIRDEYSKFSKREYDYKDDRKREERRREGGRDYDRGHREHDRGGREYEGREHDRGSREYESREHDRRREYEYRSRHDDYKHGYESRSKNSEYSKRREDKKSYSRR